MHYSRHSDFDAKRGQKELDKEVECEEGGIVDQGQRVRVYFDLVEIQCSVDSEE